MIMNTEIKKAQNEFTETETEIQRLKKFLFGYLDVVIRT